MKIGKYSGKYFGIQSFSFRLFLYQQIRPENPDSDIIDNVLIF
jgi:hypothetical protein